MQFTPKLCLLHELSHTETRTTETFNVTCLYYDTYELKLGTSKAIKSRPKISHTICLLAETDRLILILVLISTTLGSFQALALGQLLGRLLARAAVVFRRP